MALTLAIQGFAMKRLIIEYPNIFAPVSDSIDKDTQ